MESLLVRPEHICLLASNAPESPADANGAQVKVEDFIYVGSGDRCKFHLADGCEGVARIPRIDGLGVRIGDSARIEWDVKHGVILDAE
jgi:hypothetical protein